MVKMYFTLVMSLLFMTGISAQKVNGYQIFTSKGKKISFEQMIKDVSEQDIVFFGELHNDPIAHWLQYEMVKSIHTKRRMVIGAEMFEADNQKGLDDYLQGISDQDSFKKAVRLWNNYATDYKKVVDFSKDNNISFIATNIPRSFARLVFRGGFEALDTLSAGDKRWIAPLPVMYDAEVPCYRKMREMDMGGHEASENFPKAQAIKDATMAHFILKNHLNGSLFFHLNGSYHSDNYEGIVWYIKKQDAGKKIKTISTVLQKQTGKLDKSNENVADYIICVDEDMTTTY
jgi:uncharacterized iron-regulated protein